MTTPNRTTLHGINFHIHEISMPHRKGLISLLKIEFDDYHPIYSKVNPGFIRLLPKQPMNKKGERNSCEPCGEDVEEFGIFNMFETREKSIRCSELDKSTSDQHALSVELYSDRSELEMICAGKVDTNIFRTLSEGPDEVTNLTRRRHPLFKTDPIMNCCNFMTLQQISDKATCMPYNLPKQRPFTREESVDLENLVTSSRRNTSEESQLFSSKLLIPLYYKTQGRFSIEAGYLLLSVRVYSVDMNLLQSQMSLANPHQHLCPRCDGLAPAVPDDSDYAENNNISFQTHTTNEEEEESVRSDSMDSALLRDEYDSVDEFIQSFNRRTSIAQGETSSRHLLQPSLPPPPPQEALPPHQRVPASKPSKRKRKAVPKKRTRNFVYENTIFPKPRQPSRSEKLRYLKFK